MPEMHFLIEWPNGRRDRCYSPSYVVSEHIDAGREYAVDEFVARVSRALGIASERVRERYGFACSSALDQRASLEAAAMALSPAERAGAVKVLAFDKHPPRDARGAASGERTKNETQRNKAMEEHHPVVVVGAGQAGLSVSYCLKELGIGHLVLEKSRIGSSWRSERWDTFCLVTPNWQCLLPGHPYAGDDPHGFMKKDAIVAYLDSYVASFEPPVREGVEVGSVTRGAGGGGFEVETSGGRMTADHVIVATGGYHTPRIPGAGRALSPDIVQVHSAAYRNPESLPEGEVLVVGTGQSGCQIAEDLHLAGRKVHLCVGPAPRCARRYRGRDVVEWLHLMGYYDLPYDAHPNKDTVRDRANHYVTGRDGGHDIDLRQFALEGMRLYGPLRSIRGDVLELAPGLTRNLDEADDVYRSINRSIDDFIAKRGLEAPVEAPYSAVWHPPEEVASVDCRAAGIRSVVWSTGFTTDFGWIKLPAFDGDGQPVHQRGVTAVDGLFFIGLQWLHTWGSGRFAGVGTDARHIAARIARPMAQTRRASNEAAEGLEAR
jgi:putative flavoprotein involved in K+ transport